MRCLLTVALVIVFGATVCVGFDLRLEEHWAEFKRTHGRVYTGRTEHYRRGLWETKLMEIAQHNSEAEQGKHLYTMKETEWDDLTDEEFPEYQNGNGFNFYNIHRAKRASINGTGDCFNEDKWNDDKPYNLTSSITSIPDNVDWVQKGYVTPIRNQGSCGSCWAFSAVGALEGQWYKKTKKLVVLSPQFLVDCAKDTGNNGCNGGLPSLAFKSVVSQGIDTEKVYPYKAMDGTCKRTSSAKTRKIKGYRTINSKEELLDAVAFIGPVSSGMKTGPKIRNVGTGIFTDCSGRVNHAILIVGYGVVNKIKVWKVKNSWGPGWGNKGYFYMKRDLSCGIGTFAAYPTIDENTRGPIDAGEVKYLGSQIGRASQTSISFSVLAGSVAVYFYNTALRPQ